MDENPYKAPQEQGGGRPRRSHVSPRRVLDLVAVVVVAVVVVFLLWLLVAPLLVPPWPD